MKFFAQGEAPLECVVMNYSEARLCQPALDIAILLYTSTQKGILKYLGHL